MEFLQVIPIFRMYDLERTKGFYVGFLGMTIDWEHRFDDNAPLFMQVSRGAFRLRLSEHHGDGTPGANITVQMEGLDAFHAEVTSRGYRYMRPGIMEQSWGQRDMTVIDPVGNHITFSEPIKPQAQSSSP